MFQASDSSVGVEVSGIGAVGNRILSNSIFSNKELGIDLFGDFEDASGNTANDPATWIQGPTTCRTSMSSARKSASGKTLVKGRLGSAPNRTYTIQLFSNPKGTNEGKKLIGQRTSLTTDSSGKVSFSFSTRKAIALGSTIIATAIDSSALDTSEFSAPKKVVAS
ncbi:MAG TPA: hypothetical protein VF068_04595 [Rubrobacter sp.]